MRIHARDLAVGDVLHVNEWRLHVVRVEHDNAVAVLAAGLDFLIHFGRDEFVTVEGRALAA